MRPVQSVDRGGRGGPRPNGYLALLSCVRRQRVQTSYRVGVPLTSTTNGWRLGFMRRCARTRFIPDSLLSLFDTVSWPRAGFAEAAMPAPLAKPQIDIQARLRGMWQ